MHDDRTGGDRRPNHLQGQTSPYLLQHLYNPVDWRPWGPEALAKAREEDKPLFVSIGYSACHWCHVMERESFENEEFAEFLNRHFVPVKVDREERPDIDEIYMNAAQMMTGSGGWPLNVFLTPDLQPFVAGTYFPPFPGAGRIGFGELLERVREVWTTRRDDVARSAEEITGHLRRIAAGGVDSGSSGSLGTEAWSLALHELTQRYEPRWGGFGGAPKFPPDGAIALLLRDHELSGNDLPLRMATHTLESMARGGIYDHVGGGFARYSVDERWLVPHFEKMLYNQALLAPLYADAWRITGKPLFRRVATETLDFVRRELTSNAGGFFSSLDADSEGEEGRFYVWSPAEIADVLPGDDAASFCEIFDVTDLGNFEGRNIPNLLAASLAERAQESGTTEARLAETIDAWRVPLLAARERRIRPGTDDKILTAWNGLMISAFARVHQVLGRAEDLAAARGAAEFAHEHLTRDDRLLASHRDGRSALNAYLDDHAFLGLGLLDLYEACFDSRYLERTDAVCRTLIARFEDRERGGFFFTSDDHEELLTRNRSGHDGAIPSGAGVAAQLLLRAAVHLDRAEYRESARRALASSGPSVSRAPSAFASMLIAADLDAAPAVEVAIVGRPDDPELERFVAVARKHGGARLAIAATVGACGAGPSALLAGKTPVSGKATAYVCRDYACLEPTGDLERLTEILVRARGADPSAGPRDER